MKFRKFDIPKSLVVVLAEVPTDKLYPLVDHAVGYEKGTDQAYNEKLDRIVASVAEIGVIEPVIAHNRLDDGMFQVCIGCQRYFAAKTMSTLSGLATAMMCIVNCLKGQKHIPEGRHLMTADDVAACFEDVEMASLCLEDVPNPEVRGWRAPGGHGNQAFDYGDGGTKGGVYCSPAKREW